ncbi:MAG: hypothetical protein GKR94_30740 [Gammaproteobacteria bacterium]|nr:hypothetical protein [Gammaproteobacteria bacterium]
MNAIKLTLDDRAFYECHGYLILRSHFDERELQHLDGAIAANIPDGAYAPGCVYPQPAKYTLSEQSAADPRFAYIIEHPKVLSPAEQLLGGPSHLTAYVIYVRTPGDPGSLAHNDYKRWRPVGSSMNWLFAILALTDFDQETGPLLVAPGSHQLNLVQDRGEKTLHRGAPQRPQDNQFIDAQLKRGDLLLMNMYTWHWAPPNNSARDRIGVFNKYAAADAPPAAGYFVNVPAVAGALSPTNKRLIAITHPQGVTATRALCTRGEGADTEVLVTRPRLNTKQNKTQWQLPGGGAWEESVIPGWDVGNRIASLGQHLQTQAHAACPWMSYVGDYEDGSGGGLCRVYGYTDRTMPEFCAGNIHDSAWESTWLPAAQAEARIAQAYASAALAKWQDPSLIRGKGLTQAQSKIDQYAL